MVIKTPPKADMGSPSNALFQEFNIEDFEATPQGLLCLRTQNVVSLKSDIKFIAESISNKLLYEISLPWICVKTDCNFP